MSHVTEEAADWFGRIREGEPSSAERKRFAQWLAESPVHVREYLGVSETWGALQSAQCWPEDSSQELIDSMRAVQGRNIVDFAGVPKASLASVSRAKAVANRGFAMAAALALAAVGAVWLLVRLQGQVYSTARGEQRSVVLADGSVIQLNTLTRVVVHFDGDSRRIELPKGEAFFRVARDANRPFEVETPFALVRVLGTEFSVLNRETSTRVAVIEGKVQVASRSEGEGTRLAAIHGSATAPKSVALGPREYVNVGARAAGFGAAAGVLPEAGLATAWIQRRIVFDNERVDEAVKEFNRYNKAQIRVEDARLAALRISGVFSADDPEALMKYLERIQGVAISRESGESVLRLEP